MLDELAAAAVEVDEAAMDVEMDDRGSEDISCWRRSLSRELMVVEVVVLVVGAGEDDVGGDGTTEGEAEDDCVVGVGKVTGGFDTGENEEEDGSEVVDNGGNEDDEDVKEDEEDAEDDDDVEG